MSTIQDGFANSITVRGIPLSQAYPGEVFWVNNDATVHPQNGVVGVDVKGAGTYLRPFNTIDYAIGRCTANRGDIIFVMPGYTQTLTAATSIALDTAGVAIVGLGAGNLRPQLRVTIAAGAIAITAADTALVNLDLVAAVADATGSVTVSAAGRGTSLENCNFLEEATDENYVNGVVLTTLVHDVSVRGCQFIFDDIGALAHITGVVHDRLYIEDCIFYQNTAQTVNTALIVGSDVTSSLIRNCSFRNNVDDAKMIGLSGTCTGAIYGCSFSSIDTAGATGSAASTFVTGGMNCHNCFVSGDANGWGIVGGGTAIAA